MRNKPQSRQATPSGKKVLGYSVATFVITLSAMVLVYKAVS